MPGHDIIVIGASAGGVEALRELVGHLPNDLPASLFVVLHISPYGTSALPTILNYRRTLSALHPTDNQPIEKGKIYVAPPDHHLIIKDSRVRLVRGPRENRHRPAIDPLFRSAAYAFGPRVVGVVLSGTMDDGTAGLLTIKRHQGVAIVQDPEQALYPSMPLSALEHVPVDYTLSVPQIAECLTRLAHEEIVSAGEPPVPDNSNPHHSGEDLDAIFPVIDEIEMGPPSAFVCPECGGSLWELHDGELVRYRCRVGHAFSAQSLLAEQGEAVEDALWTALRALEERASLLYRMARRAASYEHKATESRFSKEAVMIDQQAELLRQLLLSGVLRTSDEPPEFGEENRNDPDRASST